MPSDRPTTSLTPVAARGCWMMLGPTVLVLLAFAIVRQGNGWFTAADVAFLVVLHGLIFARWLEFRAGDPRQADGEPATQAHFRRYVFAATMLGLSAWVVANVLGNHVLAR